MTDTTTDIADALTGAQALATVKADPAAVLLRPELWDRFFAAIRKTLAEAPCDLSTEAGRKAIASSAYSVTRTKTAIDNAAKVMKKEINDRQKTIYDQLDKLAVETRAPLTAWEEAEDARKAKCQAITDRIARLSKIEWNDTADGVILRLCDLEMIELDPVVFGDALEQAQASKAQAIETMTTAVTRLEKEEEDAAELKRLKDAEAKRLKDAEAAAEAQRVAEAAESAKKAALEAAAAVEDEFTDDARATVTEAAPVMMVGQPGTFASEASIAAAAGMSTEPVETRQVLTDSAEIVSTVAAAPSAERQSTVSEASKVDMGRLEMIDAMLPYFDGDSLEDCIDKLAEAIIDGKIPHVRFDA